MIKSFHIVIFLIVLVFWGCNSSSESGNKEDIYKGIPSSAYAVAENDSVIVFINDETIADSIEGLHPSNKCLCGCIAETKKKGRKYFYRILTQIWPSSTWSILFAFLWTQYQL